MIKKLMLLLILGNISFSKSVVECKPILWKDMDRLDKNIYLILKKYNRGKEPLIKLCNKKKVNGKSSTKVKTTIKKEK